MIALVSCSLLERECTAALKRRDSFYDLSFIENARYDLPEGITDINVLKGNFEELPETVKSFIAENVSFS